MSKLLWPNTGRFSAAALCLAALTACADLSSVQKLATAGEKTGAALAPIAGDIEGSCERTKSYEKPDVARARDCAAEKALGTPVQALSGILERYLAILGSLAGGKVGVYDASVTGLVSGLESSGRFNKDQLAAAGGIAKFVGDTLTDTARRQSLSDAIRSQNGNLRIVVSALSDVVGTDYRRMLDNEGEALDSYYETLLHEHGATEPLAAMIANIERQRARDALDARRRSAEAYARALDSLSEAHQNLFDGRDNLGSKQLMAEVLANAETIESLREKASKAF